MAISSSLALHSYVNDTSPVNAKMVEAADPTLQLDFDCMTPAQVRLWFSLSHGEGLLLDPHVTAVSPSHRPPLCPAASSSVSMEGCRSNSTESPLSFPRSPPI